MTERANNMDIAERLKNICLAVWEKVIDYYSFVPFEHIIIFNLTVPLVIRIILAGRKFSTVLIYIAANAVFFLCRMKKITLSGERISSRETAKRLAITFVSAMTMYTVTALAGFVYFIDHLSDMFWH